jgi:hypothetical protein
MMLVTKGATDVTTYFHLRLTADGTDATGLTVTNFDLQYVRSGATPAAKVDASALGAANSAHADNSAIEVDSTDQPGLYRVDWPDAAFATGVDEVLLTVKCATAFTETLRVRLMSATRGLTGTAVPDAAADAAGGLIISDAGGLDADAQLVTKINDILTDTGTTLDGKLNTIDGIVDDILVDTAEIGAAGAGLTNINLPNQTMDIVGNITGNLSGSVGSVTGAVGSVTAGVTLAASAVQAIWDALTSALTTVNSIGKLLVDNINATISSRATQTSVDDLPTNAELATSQAAADDATLAAIAALNNLSAAQVNAEVDTALADIHLDHLLAVTYDPASKPGAADALLNELVENDGGVARYTANALEQAPTGGSAPTAAEIADAVWEEALADHEGTVGSTAEALADAGGSGASAADIADAVWDEATAGHTTSGTFGEQLKTDLDAVLADSNELQTDWANGGRLDNILDARASQSSVDDLPTNAELATALAAADDAVLAAIAALNNLSQANIRTAIGLGSANLDTQLADLPTNAELATALGTADDAVLAAIAALNNISSAQVKAQVVAALSTDTYAEPGAVPAATASLTDKVGFMMALARNRSTLNGTTGAGALRNAGNTADIATRTDSDDGTTYVKGSWT